FSQFTSMLDILGKELEKNNITYSYLSGKTKNRKDLVNEFNNDPEKSVFLISLKAGGTGLNLTSADNVIIFDPWWNPSVENQAIDRAHRIGQKNSVNVHRLITKGTIEEKIVNLQEKKQFLFDNMIGETSDLFKKLTWEDVKEIFE
ncbi:DEAD/DEAH box helicase, partial [Patescibacteria group bacterium]